MNNKFKNIKKSSTNNSNKIKELISYTEENIETEILHSILKKIEYSTDNIYFIKNTKNKLNITNSYIRLYNNYNISDGWICNLYIPTDESLFYLSFSITDTSNTNNSVSIYSNPVKLIDYASEKLSELLREACTSIKKTNLNDLLY